MIKTESPRMQCHPTADPTRMLARLAAVPWITKNRMPLFSQMHANLITASGFQLHFEKRRIGQTANDAEMRDRQFGIGRFGNRHPVEILASR